MYVLGIDAGGTKTVCMLADGNGAILAEARGPGANLQASGELEVEKVLHAVMDEALGDHAPGPEAIALGIAGVDRDEDAAVVRAIMRRIGAKARTIVVNDALVALIAGADQTPAIVVIAGTGSIAYGRNARDQAARAGGWGHILADEGSGYWMGRQALRAVMRQSDGRGQPTLLTGLVLAHFGIAEPEDLIYKIYHHTTRPPFIAALARLVEQAAVAGDEVAHTILDEAARELTLAARSVTEQLGMAGDRFPFLLAGGMFKAVPSLVPALQASLTDVAPRATVSHMTIEPAVGAVRLALAEARGRTRLPSYVRGA
jgi:glucosamine kinase